MIHLHQYCSTYLGLSCLQSGTLPLSRLLKGLGLEPTQFSAASANTTRRIGPNPAATTTYTTVSIHELNASSGKILFSCRGNEFVESLVSALPRYGSLRDDNVGILRCALMVAVVVVVVVVFGAVVGSGDSGGVAFIDVSQMLWHEMREFACSHSYYRFSFADSAGRGRLVIFVISSVTNLPNLKEPKELFVTIVKY